MRTSVEIDHLITYKYNRSVSLTAQTIRLRPINPVHGYVLNLTPDTNVSWYALVNHGWAVVTDPIPNTRSLGVRSLFIADIDDAKPYVVRALMDECRAVHEKIRYFDRAYRGVQEPGETLERGTGTCRDFAWLLVHMLRGKGYDARFVSGYYVHLGTVISADFHAWVEVNYHGRWTGLDPTFGAPIGGCYIPVSSARHHRNAVPISGKVEPKAEVEFSWEISCHGVDVPGGDSRRREVG